VTIRLLPHLKAYMTRKLVFKILKWVISLALITWLYSGIDWAAFQKIRSGLRPSYLLVGFAGILLNTALCAEKWRRLLRFDGIHLPFRVLFTSYWIGSFFSLFLPSSIGGDSYRVIDIAKRTGQGTRTFTSVVADRLSGFMALSLVGLVGGIMGYRSIQEASVIWAPLMFFGLFCAFLGLVLDRRIIPWGLRLLKLDRFPKLTTKYDLFADTFRKYAKDQTLLSQVAVLSFLFHASCITVIWLYSGFLGQDYPILWFFIFIPVISIVEALPISVYGIGVRDTAYVTFFAFVGIPAEYALLIALTHVAMNVIFASMGGMLFLFRKGSKPIPAVPASSG